MTMKVGETNLQPEHLKDLTKIGLSDEKIAVTFLKSVYQYCRRGFINLRFLPSGENMFIPLSEIDSILSILEAHRSQNVFFGVATRKNGVGTKKGVIEIPCLWVDLDLKEFTEEGMKMIRKRFKEFPLKPSLVVNSGGGVHLYWKLKEPLSDAEIAIAEDYLKRLASFFEADTASTDASRILRMPGTLNYKYSPPRKVRIKILRSDLAYNLLDFDFLPSIETTEEGKLQGPPMGWENELLSGVPEGERNIAITRLTGRYLGKGLSRNEILPILLDANSRFVPPLPLKEIERVLDSMIKTHSRNNPPSEQEEGFELDKATNEYHFSLIQAKDILSVREKETDWIWEEILPIGGLSLVIAKPKVGKTTFAFNLAVAISRGDTFLGKKTLQATVIYLALEEKRSELQKKLSSLGIADEPLFFHFGPAPIDAMKEVEALIREKEANFLIIDILQKFCRVKDLNDYAQVTRALEPLMVIARQLNCHIQLIHHAGKKDRQDGDDTLGSTGLLGGVDTSIHIKKRERRRSFFTIQRYGEDVPETVIDLLPDGSLEVAGRREEVEIGETLPLILEALDEGPLTINEIWERVEKRHDLVSKGVKMLVENGQVSRSGDGKKGNPFVYEKNPFFPSPIYMREGGKECKDEDKGLNLLDKFLHDNSKEIEKLGEGIDKEYFTFKKKEQVSSLNIFEGEI
ncbi:MAG: AAA family ATPase [Syntrophaceae bacterium]|nr:AAA family ATPase [Syntrophaceae bacterium]